jgi:hypothetical protein
LSNLTILDACSNYMSGQIPKCLEVLGDTLIVLNVEICSILNTLESAV